jgi:drug/metabolite transporter (DMT)-like permease
MSANATSHAVRRALQLPKPLLIAAFCVLWSSGFSVTKLALADCPPLFLLTARFLIAGLVMLSVAALGGMNWGRLTGRDFSVLALLGIANNALHLGLNYLGMHGISSGLSALIISCNPVLTALFATIFLDERMTLRKAAGLVLGLAGIAVVVAGRMSNGSDSSVGILLTIGALLSLVGGTILFKRLAPNGGLWIGNGVQNLVSGLVLFPFAFTFERVSDVVPSLRLAFALAYCVLFVSIFGYLLWFHLLTRSGATAASAYHFLMPPLGMLFGWLLLGEHVAGSDLFGIVPVALGIYLVTRSKASPPTARLSAMSRWKRRGGGVISVVRDGDLISIDLAQRKLDLLVEPAEIERRRAAYVAPEPRVKRGYLKFYADHVAPASEGAVLPR